MTQGINNPLPPPSSPFKATLILRYFLRYFSSTSTEQISPDSAGPFIVSILLALLFSLIQRRRSRMVLLRHEGRAHSRNGDWRADDASGGRRRHLDNREGFHQAFYFGWNTSRFQSTELP